MQVRVYGELSGGEVRLRVEWGGGDVEIPGNCRRLSPSSAECTLPAEGGVVHAPPAYALLPWPRGGSPYTPVDALVVIDAPPSIRWWGLEERHATVLGVTMRTMMRGKQPLQLLAHPAGGEPKLDPHCPLYEHPIVLAGDASSYVAELKLEAARLGYGLEAWKLVARHPKPWRLEEHCWYLTWSLSNAAELASEAPEWGRRYVWSRILAPAASSIEELWRVAEWAEGAKPRKPEDIARVEDGVIKCEAPLSRLVVCCPRKCFEAKCWDRIPSDCQVNVLSAACSSSPALR